MELFPDKKLHIRKIEMKRHDCWYLYGRMPRVPERWGTVHMCSPNIITLRGMNWLASIKCAGITAVSSYAEKTGLYRQEQGQLLGRAAREGSACGQPREHGWRTTTGESTALEPHYLLSAQLLPHFPRAWITHKEWMLPPYLVLDPGILGSCSSTWWLLHS